MLYIYIYILSRKSPLHTDIVERTLQQGIAVIARVNLPEDGEIQRGNSGLHRLVVFGLQFNRNVLQERYCYLS